MAEASDLNTAIHKVLKASFCNLNLARGINESCRAIEEYHNGDSDQKSALCILADDCDNDGYKKLIVALCTTEKVPLLHVDSKTNLGEWAGFVRYDDEENARKVKACGVVVVRRWPESEKTQVDIIQQHMQQLN